MWFPLNGIPFLPLHLDNSSFGTQVDYLFLQKAHPELPGWFSIASLPWTTTLCASLNSSTDHWHQQHYGDWKLLDVRGGWIHLCIPAPH